MTAKTVLITALAAAGAGAWAQQVERLTLDEAVKIAKSRSYDVEAARADARRAKAVVSEAQASLIPQLSFNANYTRYTNEHSVQFDPSQPPIVVRPIDRASLNLQLNQPIDLFGVSRLALRGAKSLQQASEALVVSVSNNVELRVKNAFFDVLRAQELAAVADERVKNAQDQRELARKRVDAGTAPRYDIVRFDSEVATAEQQRITALNNVELAKANFNEALSRDVTTQFELVAPTGLPEVHLTLEKLLVKAGAQRPDIQAAKLRHRYQSAFTSARQRENLPTINLTGTSTLDPQAAGLSGERNVTYGTAVLSFPIFDAGRNRARVAQARAEEDKSRIAVQQAILSAELEVKQAYLNVMSAKESIRSATANVESAREVLRIARVRYEAEVATPYEISDANLQYVNAQTALVNATYAYWQAIAALQRATASEDV